MHRDHAVSGSARRRPLFAAIGWVIAGVALVGFGLSAGHGQFHHHDQTACVICAHVVVATPQSDAPCADEQVERPLLVRERPLSGIVRAHIERCRAPPVSLL